mgnify:CR=1 FL=1
MTNNDNKVESGVPRPYSRKVLPTPRNVLNKSVSPFKLWHVLVLGLTVIAGIIYALHSNGYSFASEFMFFGGSLTMLSIGLGSFSKNENRDIRDIPSISDVSNTIEYVRAASRLSVLTILGGILTIVLLIVSHISNSFYYIDDSTRLTIVLFLGLAFVGSYLIVKSLCSYSSIYEGTILSIPVKVSSIPEIVTILGFVISPLLIISTGLIYNGPVIVDTPFDISIIDTIVVLSSMLYLYISAVSRV